MKKGLLLSCIVHSLVLLWLAIAFFFMPIFSPGIETPVAVELAFVPEAPILPPTPLAPKPLPMVPIAPKPLPAAPKAPVAPKAPKAPKPSIKPKPAIAIKKITTQRIKPAAIIKSAKPALPKQLIKPKSQIAAEKKNLVKPSLQRTHSDDSKLGQGFAKKIGNCVQSKFNLVALGSNKNHNGLELKIKAAFRLEKSGALQGDPHILVIGGDEHQQEIAYSQVMSALKSCAPFTLPLDKYYLWSDVEMLFNPYQKVD